MLSTTTMDHQIVCCMCGDVGFQDKLFRCAQCHNRFQHSYCSNYYSELSDPIERCDWCQSEEKSQMRQQGSSSSKKDLSSEPSRPEHSGDKIKQRVREETTAEKGKSQTGMPSPRQATRRYKLLKDVMC